MTFILINTAFREKKNMKTPWRR